MATGLVYDVAAVSRILGIRCDCNDPVPQAAEGEIVIYYGGWDIKTLCETPAGKTRMWGDDPWHMCDRRQESAYYRLLLPVPGSNEKAYPEQLRHLQSIHLAWQPAPAVIVVTALLVHLHETGQGLVDSSQSLSCREIILRSFRAAFTVYCGRICFRESDDTRGSAYAWFAASRKY